MRLKAIQHFFEHYKDLEPASGSRSRVGGPGCRRARRSSTASRTTRSRRAPLPRHTAPCRGFRQAGGRGCARSGRRCSRSMPAPSRARKRSTASAKAGWASQWANWCCTGSRPRAILCSPCAPPSKRVIAVGDAPGQRLVVAGLEVQAGHVLQRAPVAAVGDCASTGRNAGLCARSATCGDRLAVALRPRTSARCSGIVRAMRRKKSRRQVGRSGARGRSARSSGRRNPSRRPVMSLPGATSKRTPASRTLRALLPDLLALVVLQAARGTRRSRG